MGVSTKLPDHLVSLLFRTMLALLSLYIFVQAWQSYQGGRTLVGYLWGV